MGEIAEQKALEEYPPCINSNGFDLAESRREGYIQGYNQGTKDFLEKAEKILTERMYFSDDEAKQFKNYMKDGGSVTSTTH